MENRATFYLLNYHQVEDIKTNHENHPHHYHVVPLVPEFFLEVGLFPPASPH